MSYNREKCNQQSYMESQWKAYMGPYTTLTLDEAYDVYVRPGMGGKKWTKQEQMMFKKIVELAGQENPYIFRFCPEKPTQQN